MEQNITNIQKPKQTNKQAWQNIKTFPIVHQTIQGEVLGYN